MRPHLTVKQRQLARRLKDRGLSLREIGPQVGCSHRREDRGRGARQADEKDPGAAEEGNPARSAMQAKA
jgi:IS30 family transposase